MAKTLLGDLGMHSLGEKLGGMRVPKVLESNAGEILHPPYQVIELMGQAPRLQRHSVGAAAHQGLACLPNAQGEQFLGLLTPEPTEFVDRECGKGDGTTPTRLRVLKPQFTLCLLKA